MLSAQRYWAVLINWYFQAVAEHILLAAKDDTAPSADRVYSKESFAKEHCTWNEIQLSEPDVDVLLTYLSRDEQKIAYDGKVCPTSITQSFK